ncbi:cytochrome P450 [Mycena leptocephala]|nr:cytochrome P450 [Mycena leptocephala]
MALHDQLEFLFSTAATAILLILFISLWRRRAFQRVKSTSTSISTPSYTSISYPVLGSLQYFSRHWDFLQSATKNGTSSASFHLAHHKCIAIATENRHAFFNDSRFSFALAYAVMLGATPSMNKDFLSSMGFDITLGGRSNKLLFALVRKERINNNLSTLYSYAEEGIRGLSATTNPFDTIYATIFRMTINTVAASSVAANPALCNAFQTIFRELDQSGTPFTILFPWFLGWERIQRFYLMKKFYNIMTTAIDDRKKEGRDDEDPMQYLIDAGLSSIEITQFTLAALFAGIANTGIVAAYILCDLAAHPEYLALVREEVLDFLSSFNPDESIPVTTRIKSITSYEDWIQSGKLPILERCLKETIRLRLSTPLHRLNDTGKDIDFNGMRIPDKTILSFHTNFLHHNEDIYTTRPPGTRSASTTSEGRTVRRRCPSPAGVSANTSASFAKFEIYLLTALMVTSYDMEAVNKAGQPTQMPPAELNNTVIAPPDPEVFLKLSARH